VPTREPETIRTKRSSCKSSALFGVKMLKHNEKQTQLIPVGGLHYRGGNSRDITWGAWGGYQTEKSTTVSSQALHRGTENKVLGGVTPPRDSTTIKALTRGRSEILFVLARKMPGHRILTRRSRQRSKLAKTLKPYDYTLGWTTSTSLKRSRQKHKRKIISRNDRRNDARKRTWRRHAKEKLIR